MKFTEKFKQTIPLDAEATKAPPEPKPALNVVAVFQDAPTREWAMQVFAKVGGLVGEDFIRSTWWEIRRLADPDLLADAVHAAVEADVVMMSFQAASGPPPELRAWIDAWLPRRQLAEGALVALLAVDVGARSQVFSAQEYLRTVARAGRLDFLPHEQRVPAASASRFMQKLKQRANTMTGVLHEILDHNHETYRHWGLNE